MIDSFIFLASRESDNPGFHAVAREVFPDCSGVIFFHIRVHHDKPARAFDPSYRQ